MIDPYTMGFIGGASFGAAGATLYWTYKSEQYTKQRRTTGER